MVEVRHTGNNGKLQDRAMTPMGDLLGPDPILLPGDPDAEAELLAGEKSGIVAAGSGSAVRAAGAPWARDTPQFSPNANVVRVAKAAPRADRERVMYDSVAKC